MLQRLQCGVSSSADKAHFTSTCFLWNTVTLTTCWSWIAQHWHLHRRRNSKSRRRSQPRPPCGWSVLSGKFVAWLLKLLHEICSADGGQVATLIQTSVPWCMTWHPLWTLNLESWLVNPGVFVEEKGAMCFGFDRSWGVKLPPVLKDEYIKWFWFWF